jgi:hypothetical protein
MEGRVRHSSSGVTVRSRLQDGIKTNDKTMAIRARAEAKRMIHFVYC